MINLHWLRSCLFYKDELFCRRCGTMNPRRSAPELSMCAKVELGDPLSVEPMTPGVDCWPLALWEASAGEESMLLLELPQ